MDRKFTNPIKSEIIKDVGNLSQRILLKLLEKLRENAIKLMNIRVK